jgi:hypothetical protein
MTELMPTFKINVDEAQVPAYTLPDPLLMASGEPVLEAAAWREGRRAEILALFETHVYGKTPAAPVEVGATVTACDLAALFEPSALSGGAMRKEVRLHFSTEHGTSWMDLLVYLPAQATGPVPVFVGLNFWGNHSIHLDPAIRLSSQWMPDDAQRGFENNRAAPRSRGQSAHRWPVETILGHGYGLATAYYGDLAPDDPHLYRSGVHGLFAGGGGQDGGDLTVEPAADVWGAIGAWAWGLSRALDYFGEDDQIDHRRVAVLGHSRLGKAALWAGAQDERFALVISNNSGCGGAALSRRQFGETVEAINARFPHWFCANFKQFGDDVGRLPVDQHLLLALIAPRPLYVASAEQDLWADPHGEFLAARAAGAVYRFLGSDGLAAETMPPVGQPVSGAIGYHIRPGEHDLTDYDWLRFLDFADRHLRSEPGKESVG